MQAKQYVEYVKNSVSEVLANDKKVLILTEIGYDQIATATSFVEYLYEKYGFSRSSVWYNLKALKGTGVLDFAEKGGENKPLSLTKNGVALLRSVQMRRVATKAAGYY